jgi:hydroxymethylbilane synthase
VKHVNVASLPAGAKVGTSSQRRRAQLKQLRPDVEAVEFRGNVDTRLRKLSEGQVEAILLAAAGLDRLEKTEWVRQRLEPADFCPAAGQGSLGIETRLGDAATIAALAFFDDAATRYAVTAERAALAALGGGCQVPIGIHCRAASDGSADPADKCWEIFGVVASPHTGRTVRAYHSVPGTHCDPTALGRAMAEMLLSSGARELLNEIPQAAGGAA